MSSKSVLVIGSNLSVAGFSSICDLEVGGKDALRQLTNFFQGVAGGLRKADLTVNVGALSSDGYLTVAAGGSVAAQACTICNITLTGRASAPATNEFVVSATAATQATNMANAINASASFTGKVVASTLLGRLILTAVTPGVFGNSFQLSAGNLANVTVGRAFTNGSNGTTYTL